MQQHVGELQLRSEMLRTHLHITFHVREGQLVLPLSGAGGGEAEVVAGEFRIELQTLLEKRHGLRVEAVEHQFLAALPQNLSGRRGRSLGCGDE